MKRMQVIGAVAALLQAASSGAHWDSQVIAQAPSPRPAATIQQVSSPDPAVTKAFAAHLKAHSQSAEDYVVSRFQTHDVVFLGEEHLTRPRLLFLQRLIPLLYRAGVHTLGYEMANTDDQQEVDRLVNAPAFDEAAAFETLARWDFMWPYQEYADVFRAAWEVNKGLPAGAPRFRILALDVRPDYRRLLPGMDPKSYESRGLIVGGDRDLVRNVRMADVLRQEVVRKGIKALVFNGGGHSQTRYRRPSRDSSGPRRMSVGYMIHSQIGDRAMSVMVIGPQPAGKDAVTDLVMACLAPGVDSGGFDTKGSPLGAVLMKAGPDTVRVEDFFDGYAFVDMTKRWRAATPNLRYITEERVRKARQEGLVPDAPAITAGTVKKDVLAAAAKTDAQLASGLR
jgi:heme-binding uptake protein ChaN (Tiki superfamily)